MITALIVSTIVMIVLSLIEIIIGGLFIFIAKIPFINSDYDITSLASLIKVSSAFIPPDIVFMLIISIVGWYVVRLAWAVLTFVANFIPGINIR